MVICHLMVSWNNCHVSTVGCRLWERLLQVSYSVRLVPTAIDPPSTEVHRVTPFYFCVRRGIEAVLLGCVVYQHVQIYELFSLVTQLLCLSVFRLVQLWIYSGDRYGA